MHPITPARKNILLFVIAIILIYNLTLLALRFFDPEQANLLFYKEVHVLGSELKDYKKVHGVYPSTLFVIRESDTICVTYSYKRCRKIYYIPTRDLQDFRIAAHSFIWFKVFFYKPEISMTPEEYQKLTKAEQDKKPYFCFYCEAYTEWYRPFPRNDTPVYRKDSRIFQNPEEWPAL